MEDGQFLSHLQKEIRLAEKFDRELPDLQRRACEPSLLGGGTRTQSIIDSLKNDATEILTEVRHLADEGKERNRASREMMDQMADRMKQMKDMLIASDSKTCSYRPAQVPRVFAEFYVENGF